MGLLISLLVLLIILGIACWIVSLIPFPPPFGRVAQAVVLLIGLLYILHGFALV